MHYIYICRKGEKNWLAYLNIDSFCDIDRHLCDIDRHSIKNHCHHRRPRLRFTRLSLILLILSRSRQLVRHLLGLGNCPVARAWHLCPYGNYLWYKSCHLQVLVLPSKVLRHFSSHVDPWVVAVSLTFRVVSAFSSIFIPPFYYTLLTSFQDSQDFYTCWHRFLVVELVLAQVFNIIPWRPVWL